MSSDLDFRGGGRDTARAGALSASDRALRNRLLGNPIDLPLAFTTWLINFVSSEIQITQSQVINAPLQVIVGIGPPEGVTAAAVGSVYLRTDGGPGTTVYFKESGSGNTGWVARDVFTNGLTLTDGKDITVGGGTGTKIGNAAAKLALFGATPVAQPAATGEFTGFTAGAGSAVDHKATFTGNLGTKAYTMNDVVKALKQLGVLAAS